MEFVVSFFSGSWPLTLKLSSKCHKMTSFLFKIMNFSLKHCPHFEWENLIYDDFLMTSWELEVKCQRKKEPQIQCSSRIFLKSIFWPLKHDFKTETCNFYLSPWILLEPIRILLEIYWNPTKVLMEPVGVLLKHSGVLNWSSAKSLKIASFCWNILKRSEKTDQRNYSYQGLTFFVAWDIECYLIVLIQVFLLEIFKSIWKSILKTNYTEFSSCQSCF